MILIFLNFFRRGLPNQKKISFLGGPAHFVTYGGGGDDGLVDNNNALTTMASALKIKPIIIAVRDSQHRFIDR
jgi:hypothetical protein